MILGVAMKCENGDVLALPKPARHANLFDKYNEMARAEGWNFPWAGWPADRQEHGEQGFISDKGRFLTREEAVVDARACGQVGEVKRTHPQSELFSEDVW